MISQGFLKQKFFNLQCKNKTTKKHTISTPSKQCRRFVVGGWLFFRECIFMFFVFVRSLIHSNMKNMNTFLFHAVFDATCRIVVCVSVFFYTQYFMYFLSLSVDVYVFWFYCLPFHFIFCVFKKRKKLNYAKQKQRRMKLVNDIQIYTRVH